MNELWFYFLLLFFTLFYILFKLTRPPANLPPSPPSLPIVGHIHLLKQPIHRTLHKLSHKYGHLIFLRLGSRKVLVVSSPEAAEECFTKNDIVFANRPEILAGKLLHYNCSTVGFAPYCDHWRNLRRLSALELFSPSSMALFSYVREEEVHLMLREFYEVELSSGCKKVKVDLRSKFSDLSFNIMMRIISGKRYVRIWSGYSETKFSKNSHGNQSYVTLYCGKYANVKDEEARLFQCIIKEVVELTVNSNMGDYFPLFKWFDIQGVQKRMTSLNKKMDKFFQDLIDEHRQVENESKKKTLIGAMLLRQEIEPELHSDDIIKGIILALLTAGTETATTTLEWAMSLLLNHPQVMIKSYIETTKCCQPGRPLKEQDLSKLNYLQSVVTETLRLFPPAPLLLPHESSDHCKVCGYDVPRGTMLLVNLWTIQRDPKLWEESNKFKPERFSEGEFEGYKLMPFGAGRRACPGSSLGQRVVMLALGAMIQFFEWERVSTEEIDLVEGAGLTMSKMKSLGALCKPRESMISLFLK